MKRAIVTPVLAVSGMIVALLLPVAAHRYYWGGEWAQYVHVAAAILLVVSVLLSGTAFSRCVTAMAKAAQDENVNPRKACKGLSKKHVKGEKGTEFSRCVKAAAKMRQEDAQQP